jgi:hypothetical protein
LRFFKQTLRWTTPKRRSPHAAERWTWLLLRASLRARLARNPVADLRFPLRHPLSALVLIAGDSLLVKR